MWDILRHSVIVSPGGEDLTGITDLDLVFQDGIWRLIAATRAEAGLTLLEVDGTTGALEQTDRHLLGTLDGLPPTGLDVLSFDGGAVYFSTGRSYSPFDAHTRLTGPRRKNPRTEFCGAVRQRFGIFSCRLLIRPLY